MLLDTKNKNSPDALSRLYRKISWRLLPFLLLCYVFAYLDRVNIGFAKLQMQADLGFSDKVYGIAAGMFFVGYVLFEVPSNLMLPKAGVRRTLGRIMVLWGLTSTSMLFVQNETTFYVLRFILGVFEAGFAPAMIFYMTYWYAQKRMASVMSIIWLAAPLAGIFAAPVSTWIMDAFAGHNGLAGWQWMFLLEGLPCAVLGVVAWFYLTDRPEQAQWLSAEEKRLLASQVNVEKTQHHSFRAVLRDPKIYLLAAAYFCLLNGIYTTSFWLPTLLRDAGITDIKQVGLYSSVPYIAAVVAMLIFSRSSDRLGERRLHSAIPALIAAVALALSTQISGQLFWTMVSLTVATSMTWVAYTVFWAMPGQFLKGDSAAGGIALINSIGQTGGFFSPIIIGWAKTTTGSTNAGLLLMSSLLVVGALLLLASRAPQRSIANALPSR